MTLCVTYKNGYTKAYKYVESARTINDSLFYWHFNDDYPWIISLSKIKVWWKDLGDEYQDIVDTFNERHGPNVSTSVDKIIANFDGWLLMKLSWKNEAEYCTGLHAKCGYSFNPSVQRNIKCFCCAVGTYIRPPDMLFQTYLLLA